MSCSCGSLPGSPFLVSSVTFLQPPPFLCFTFLYTSPHASSGADPQPAHASPASGKVGARGRRLGVSWGRNFWASALPAPCTNALGPSPLPRAHIWPECSVFLAVNCLLLPLGIFSGFGFVSVYFSWGIQRRMAAQSFLRLSEAVERNPWQCCQWPFCPSLG